MKRLNWKNISLILSIILMLTIFLAPIIPNSLRWISLGIIISLDGITYLYVYRSQKQNISLLHSIIKIVLVTAILIPNSIFSGFLRKISTKTESYEIHFVGLEDTTFDSIEYFDGKSIGILNDESSKVGYIYPHSIVEEASIDVKFVEYDSYVDSIQALIQEKVDIIVLPGGYEKTFGDLEGFNLNSNQLFTQLTVIKKERINSLSDHQDILNLVLIGGDNPIHGGSTSGFNYDVILVVSYNFKTQESAMISIPRDAYVTNACTNKKDKITHTGWYGAECLTKSLTNLLGITIDKYMLIDFDGIVKVVDSIGGVNVVVDQRFEENGIVNGQLELIIIEEGIQELDGNEALAYLRHRRTLEDGVYGRSNHHELFVLAMIDKLAKPSSWFKISGFMNTIQETVLTNLSGDSLLAYYNDASILLTKYGVDSLKPERLELEATGKLIYTASFGMDIFYSILDTKSLNAVKEKFQAINEIE